MQPKLETKVENGQVWFRLPVGEMTGSFLEQEETVQLMLNEIGGEVSEQLLKKYDTDGSPIEVEGVKYTSKGLEKKNMRRYIKK